ncbi:hypothetical protein CDAR_206331 [Caerostris darwini]|uniref:Uncharacterized protein n=1 Tax=Caerostris darwini TaxID=1538125 RepID=A0AAV4RK69_9ARAC|nr:hypothetical protein CDAR_206331 [Caerostris darwini]
MLKLIILLHAQQEKHLSNRKCFAIRLQMTDNTRSRSYHLKYSLLRHPGTILNKGHSVASVKFRFAQLLMKMSWTACSSDSITGFQCFSSFRDLIRNWRFQISFNSWAEISSDGFWRGFRIW